MFVWHSLLFLWYDLMFALSMYQFQQTHLHRRATASPRTRPLRRRRSSTGLRAELPLLVDNATRSSDAGVAWRVVVAVSVRHDSPRARRCPRAARRAAGKERLKHSLGYPKCADEERPRRGGETSSPKRRHGGPGRLHFVHQLHITLAYIGYTGHACNNSLIHTPTRLDGRLRRNPDGTRGHAAARLRDEAARALRLEGDEDEVVVVDGVGAVRTRGRWMKRHAGPGSVQAA